MLTTSQLDIDQLASLVNERFECETIITFDGETVAKLSIGDARCIITIELYDQTAEQPAHLSVILRLVVGAADDTVADFSHCNETELKNCLSLLGKDLTFCILQHYEAEDQTVVELFRLITIPFRSASLDTQLEVVATDLEAAVAEWQCLCSPLQLILLGEVTSLTELMEHMESVHPALLN